MTAATSNIQQMSLLFLLRENEVLLGRKKRGFAEGRWLGIGGKLEPGETVQQTAVRETLEEVGVRPLELTRMATVNFYFPHKPAWNQQVCVFTSRRWEGTPTESEEMAPQWFDSSALPLDAMWTDARHWLPQVLAGATLRADFTFDSELVIETFTVREGPW